MAALERAALTLGDLAALSLQAPERLAWERALVDRHRAGDRTAFEALYRAYAAALYARVLLPLLRVATFDVLLLRALRAFRQRWEGGE